MSRNELEEPETWAVRTFGQAELGYLRRTDRLVQLAAALARNPQSSLPEALRGEAETVGAYRFLNHAVLTPEQIQMPHWVQTRREAAARSQALMVGDTTEFNFSGHHCLQGAGPVGRGSLAQGFFVHSVLARDAESEELLGCAYQHTFVRQPAPEEETKGQRKQRERESLIWEQSVRSIGPAPKGSQWIYVGDRGSDIFPFWQACQQLGYDSVIRVAQDRGVLAEETETTDDPDLLHLKSRARQLPLQDLRLLSLPATPTHPARDAVVAVSFEAVRIQLPVHNATLHKTELALWVVRVWEPLPPPGVEPLEWLLLTSVPVFTLADVWECVRWYRCRWLIEEFHKVLKSGCGMETRRMHTIAALENLLAILTPHRHAHAPAARLGASLSRSACDPGGFPGSRPACGSPGSAPSAAVDGSHALLCHCPLWWLSCPQMRWSSGLADLVERMGLCPNRLARRSSCCSPSSFMLLCQSVSYHLTFC